MDYAHQHSVHKRSALLLDELMYVLEKAFSGTMKQGARQPRQTGKQGNGEAPNSEDPARRHSTEDSSSKVCF